MGSYGASGQRNHAHNRNRPGLAWQGLAGRGWARPGVAWRGMGPYGTNTNESEDRMIDAKDEISKATDAIYELMNSLDRGDVVTHEAIEGILGVRPHQGQWDHVVGKARRRLERERGIATWPEQGVGYKLLTRAEQLELPGWRLKRGIRQVRRGRHSLEALPEKGLTDHQRRFRQLTIERLSETERKSHQELRAQATLLKPSHVHPRPMLPTA